MPNNPLNNAAIGISAAEIRELADKIRAVGAEAADRKSNEEVLGARIEALVAGASAEVPRTADGDVDEAAWNALSAIQRQQHQTELLRYYDALTILAGSDGPTNPNSIMFRQYVSNFGVIVLTLFALLGTLSNLFAVHHYWPIATQVRPPASPQSVKAPATPDEIFPGPTEENVLLMVMLMGSMGGFIHLTGSVAKYIGNRMLVRSWIIYYFLMPVEGAGLAVVLYLMLRVGVLNPPAQNNNATMNLNWVGIYALSALAGLFSKQALEMLSDLFNTVFKRVQGKDAAAPGSAPR